LANRDFIYPKHEKYSFRCNLKSQGKRMIQVNMDYLNRKVAIGLHL
jgi:hypothetical protein